MSIVHRIAAGFAVVILAAGAAYAQDFSADTESMVSDRVVAGRYYSKPDRWRVEIELDGQRQANIFRRDILVLWQVDQVRGQYAEFPLSDADADMLSRGAIEGETRRKLVGTESIDGRLSKKYKVYYMTAVEDYLFQWIDEELKTPVRVADKNGRIITRLKNISVWPQPDELFEIPKGLSKISPPKRKEQ